MNSAGSDAVRDPPCRASPELGGPEPLPDVGELNENQNSAASSAPALLHGPERHAPSGDRDAEADGRPARSRRDRPTAMHEAR